MKLAVALLAVAVFAFPSRAADNDDNLDLLVTVIASTDDPAAQADMLRGLAAALEGK